MNFNDLLKHCEIDPKAVLVLRHRPFEPNLRRVILWLAGEQPEVFNAYQQTQGPLVEAAMLRATHVASFIGHEVGRAVFVGLYKRNGARSLTKADYWNMPAHQSLRDLGMRGWVDERESLLWFDLALTDFYSDWIGKLVVDWPGGERSWWRWADRNTLRVRSVAEDSWTPAITGSEMRGSEVKRGFHGRELVETAVFRLRLEHDHRFRRRFPDCGRTHPAARARSWKISRSKL